MSDATTIEWADTTWSPVSGCTKVSAGCKNCYAERMAKRLKGRHGYPEDNPFVVTLHPDKLEQPLKWRKGRTIFVCSMGDLFHEDVPDEFIDSVWATMALCPQHIFMVLTKRPVRMAEYLNTPYRFSLWHNARSNVVGHETDEQADAADAAWPSDDEPDRLSNVVLGTSIENQKTADERIPHLLRCPAAWRMLSVEPLLEAVDLDSEEEGHAHAFGCGHPNCECGNRGIDWVIVGGESGPGARPCNIDDIRSVVKQCRAAGVACFVKQVGANSTKEPYGMNQSVGDGEARKLGLIKHRKGGDPSEWPADIRVREQPPWLVVENKLQALKPDPYRYRYVLGVGYPRQGGSTVWLRQNRERVGSVDLFASWPAELCDGEPSDDLPQYRLVLERVLGKWR